MRNDYDINQKIEKAQERVIRTKATYDGAADEQQKLPDKETALQEKDFALNFQKIPAEKFLKKLAEKFLKNS